MKRTLLEIVQSILSDSDSTEVNSISDSTESLQAASIVRDTFYSLSVDRLVPEHKRLIKLTAASDTDFPTHFQFQDQIVQLEKLWYEDSDGDYQEIQYVEPLKFLEMTDATQSDYVAVEDKQAGTTLRITTDEDPTFYTSFDENWIVMNAYDSTVDSTLQNSKVRAYGQYLPTFSLTDSYIPELDASMFPYLESESKSVFMSLYKGASDPKIEQRARRHKSYAQNNKKKIKGNSNWNAYGR